MEKETRKTRGYEKKKHTRRKRVCKRDGPRG
jgi:hypothetical protein